MPGVPGASDSKFTAIDEIIRQKLLCDVMFGACGAEEYERLTGDGIGAYSLCLLGSFGGSGRQVSAAEILLALNGLPACRGASVFAVAPGRVAVFSERSWQVGSCAGCEGMRNALVECLEGAVDSEAAEGVGAEDLRAAYQRCDSILAERLRRASGARTGQVQAAASERHVKPVLSKAMDYIEKHFTEQITLQDVAEHAFASSFYISRLFNKELGVSFVDYLGALRVENARRLLSETQMRIFEVSERVGIQDAHYFAKLFKKHTGVSPSEYRAGNKL